MNTATHVLVASTVFAKRNAPLRNAVVFAGAILPDLSIFILYAWARLGEGASSLQIWRVIYWQEPWQTFSAISNSFPVWGLIATVGLILRLPLVAVLGAAGLLHLALDFPVHNSDAHVHFWPLTEWRFNSPLSYWDPDHYGVAVSLTEAAIGLMLAAVLWQRFHSNAARALLLLVASAYVFTPAYFLFSLSGAG